VALPTTSPISEWEWFAALRRLGKPVELIYLHDGDHVLQRPWERVTSQHGNVDWFAFWLKGEEDPDPAKAEQYARSRELRKMQEHNTPRQPQQANRLCSTESRERGAQVSTTSRM
jgi:hypothetical protein